jgi:hypothetical protein
MPDNGMPVLGFHCLLAQQCLQSPIELVYSSTRVFVLGCLCALCIDGFLDNGP